MSVNPRRRVRATAAAALLAALPTTLAGVPPAAAAEFNAGLWRNPSAGPPQVIGAYAKGCLAGAVELPADGPGWQVMRPSRNRAWGHPALIAYIRDLAASASANGWGGLLVGDLAQPRGGPFLTGHRSHQSGLDVDIWFDEAPPRTLTRQERETLGARSFVVAGGALADPALWTQAHRDLLRVAALLPAVDRIFVNAAIKRDLCDTADGDRSWLGRIRPWWGHDDHLHVRLRCPEGEALCIAGDPLPDGDGCDASLDWWFSADAQEELRRQKAAPAKQPLTLGDLPASCRTVFISESVETVSSPVR